LAESIILDSVAYMRFGKYALNKPPPTGFANNPAGPFPEEVGKELAHVE